MSDDLQLARVLDIIARVRAAVSARNLSLLAAFRLWDLDKDGWLSGTELAEACDSLLLRLYRGLSLTLPRIARSFVGYVFARSRPFLRRCRRPPALC